MDDGGARKSMQPLDEWRTFSAGRKTRGSAEKNETWPQ
jgi:hypothetical protein